MREADKADLFIIFGRDKNLKNHYLKARATYSRWGGHYCHAEFPTVNGGKIKLTPLEVLDQLALAIRNFDLDLRVIMSNRRTQENVGMGHDRVCTLFAQNALSGEAVKP